MVVGDRGGGGHSPMKVMRACRKISRTPVKGRRILCYGHVPNKFPPLRGTNSTITNYITGTANLKCNKDNFRTLLLKNVFESIVINLY